MNNRPTVIHYAVPARYETAAERATRARRKHTQAVLRFLALSAVLALVLAIEIRAIL